MEYLRYNKADIIDMLLARSNMTSDAANEFVNDIIVTKQNVTEDDRVSCMRDMMFCSLATVTKDNPLNYFDKMYSELNPQAIYVSVDKARKFITGQNIPSSDDIYNVYLEFGGEGLTENLYTGMISTLCWLPEFMQTAVENKRITKAECNAFCNTLNVVGLPGVRDATGGDAGCNEYAAFMAFITTWLISVKHIDNKSHLASNMDICKLLTKRAMNAYPAIPYGAYLVDTVNTNDPFLLIEKLNKAVKIHSYMSKEAFAIHQPRFIIQTHNSPLTAVAKHPMVRKFLCETGSNDNEWIGLFTSNEAVVNKCKTDGIDVNEIRKYIIKTSLNEHIANRNKDAVAEYVETNPIFKSLLTARS